MKPWEFTGRKMDRNAPVGRRCDGTCEHPVPSMGTKVCLCTVCHEVFSTPTHFDRHRRDGWCQNPEDLGLEKNVHGVWRQPMNDEDRDVFQQLSVV